MPNDLKTLLENKKNKPQIPNDTQVLYDNLRIIEASIHEHREILDHTTLDCQDAGTAMRFLTALCCIIPKHKTNINHIFVLEGTDRMNQRPIKILVDALTELGFELNYTQKEGFPPLQIKHITVNKFQKSNDQQTLKIDASVSSQYISALMMVAWRLKNGLIISLQNNINSKPYLMMTAELMKKMGLEIDFINQKSIKIDKQTTPKDKKINVEKILEADWSAASYWITMANLCPQKKPINFPNLNPNSTQGDKIIHQLIDQTNLNNQHITFENCPDLAMSVICYAAAKKLFGNQFSGMQSLRIKETDRIAALQIELLKFGIALEESKYQTFVLYQINNISVSKTTPITIETYQDHRIAMAFACFALVGYTLKIMNPNVVNKSYPSFWKDLKKARFETKKRY